MKFVYSYDDFLTEIRNHSEYDSDHWKELESTGYWGTVGAGVIFFAESTKRFLFAHRSSHVEQPNTWGVWGGAIDGDENPADAAIAEVKEESGYDILENSLIHLYTFHDKNFKYFNFLAVIANEFIPILNWETQGFAWVNFGEWPKPLHFGVQAILDNKSAFKIMESYSKIG